MPEEIGFSDLTYCYWDAIDEIVEVDEVSNQTYRDYFFYGIQLGPYDDEEARAILWS
jgi:hypothetical protein